MKEMRGYTVKATDGEIGKIHEFYFDDNAWTVLYLIAEIGNWLASHNVLISTSLIEKPILASVPISISKEQVKRSPKVTSEKPVSQQHELLSDTIKRPYWNSFLIHNTDVTPEMFYNLIIPNKNKSGTESFNPHMRSSREVLGYHIKADDGEIGYIEDFILDTETWIIRYIVIDTKNWLPGKKVMLGITWLNDISYEESIAFINLSRRFIEHCPEYDPAAPINREYEERLYGYYDRPKYWQSEAER